YRFHPMQTRSRDRWVSVATGLLTDVTNMPPVDLIRVGDDYYVVDGHHRISAARALRKVFIDARVTEWVPAT
ncbi:MAG: ParB N-terminal domain-containing protein, partial [Chloroflexota bacterium]